MYGTPTEETPARSTELERPSNRADAACGASIGSIVMVCVAGKPALVVGLCAAFRMRGAVLSSGHALASSVSGRMLRLAASAIDVQARTKERRCELNSAPGSGLNGMPWRAGAFMANLHQLHDGTVGRRPMS